MSTSPPDLTAFLRARLDEDEALAVSATQDTTGRWTVRETEWGGGVLVEDECGALILSADRARGATQYQHIAAHDPARVLREIDAKRRLLDDIVAGWEQADPGVIERNLRQHRGPSVHVDPETGEREEFREWTVTRQLRLLALPYDQHPDYREEWRP